MFALSKGLHFVPCLLLYDRRVLARVCFLFVLDPTDVVWIAQNRVKRSTEEVIAIVAANIVAAQPFLVCPNSLDLRS
jgi:hypothetical protein